MDYMEFILDNDDGCYQCEHPEQCIGPECKNFELYE